MSNDEEEAERLEQAIKKQQRLHELTKLHALVTGDSYVKALASTREYLKSFDERLASGQIDRDALKRRLEDWNVSIRR